MRLRVHRKRPDAWAIRRQQIRHAWAVPLWAFEWFWEWTAFVLSNWSFLEVLEYLGSFSVLIAVIFYFSESGDRLKQKHYQAWQVINTAEGKGGSGGRIEALQELNADGISLIGVNVSGAFLQGIQLRRARVVRSDFSSADLRDSEFAFADFSDANLQSANFRQSNLHGANFQRANLSEADLFGADLGGCDLREAKLVDVDLSHAKLAHIQWSDTSDMENANLFGVEDAPEGFVRWARKHGAVQVNRDAP
jgi:pentapeptide repeat protein